MYTSLVNQYSVHFQVSLDAAFFSLEFYKSVLEADTCFPISNDIARFYFAKAGEDEFEIMFLSHGIEFANEKNILWRFDVSIW